MEYFLVEVKKAFWIYPLKAQITMRGDLVEGIFKKNVKVLKKLKNAELEKEFRTEVKYKLSKEENTDVDTNENNDAEATDTQVEQSGDLPPAGEAESTEDTNTTDNADSDAGDENTDAEAGTLTNENNDVVVYEDMPTEELLRIANETYKLNKPANTGRANLLKSLNDLKNA